MEMVVVLPAPLPPSSAVIVPSQAEADAVHGNYLAIHLAQVAHLHRGLLRRRWCRGSVSASNMLRMGVSTDGRGAGLRPAGSGHCPLSGVAERARQAAPQPPLTTGRHAIRRRVDTAMPQSERPRKEASESRLRLQTAVRLRWFGVVGQLLTVCYVYFGLGFQFAIRHLPGADRSVGLAECVPAHSLSSPHAPQRTALPRRCWPTTSCSSPRCSI